MTKSVTTVTNGKVFVSVSIEKSSLFDTVDFGVKKLAPDKPKDATVWKDTEGRKVFFSSETKTWRYEPTEKGKNHQETKQNNLNPKKIHFYSENMIRELLSSKTKEEELEVMDKYRDLFARINSGEKARIDWYEKGQKSIKAIREYLEDNNEKLIEVKYVGNDKNLDDKYITSDLLIKTDKRVLGISLKKSAQARLWNSVVSRKNNPVVNDYIINMRNLLQKISGEAVNNRKDAKRILYKNNKKVFNETDGLSLMDYSILKHRELRKNLKPLRAKLAEEKIKPQVNKILDAIKNNTLIIVYEDKILDSTSLPLGELQIQDNEKTGQTLLTLGEVPMAVINIRQDGLGYGPAIKLEASISRDKRLFR